MKNTELLLNAVDNLNTNGAKIVITDYSSMKVAELEVKE